MIQEKVDLGMSSPAVRGRARVQVFDADTGDCVREDLRDNFVSPRFLRALAQHANHALFSAPGTSANGQNTLYSATGYRTTPITGIVLTDYAGEPDPEAERFVRGRPVAHGSLRQAAAGTRVGAYNAVESIHSFDYQKFVFDFATSEGNGTFQSIYSGFFNSGLSTAEHTREKEAYTIGASYGTQGNTPLQGVLRDFDSDNFYLQRDATTVYKVGRQDIWQFAYGQLPPLRDPITLPFSVQRDAAVIKGGRLYWLHYAAATDCRIYSAPLGDLANVRLEKSLNVAWATARGKTSAALSQAIGGFTYNAARNRFVIGNIRSTTPHLDFAFLELDPVTFADGDVFGTVGHARFANLYSFPDEKALICSESSWSAAAYIAETADDGSVFYTHAFGRPPQSLITPDIAFTNAYANAYGSGYALTPAQWFFSRALLDTPVTKTAQNTMKITYEFTFDPPNLG